jgi:hypothetical protein
MLFMKIFLAGWSPISALEAQVYGSRNPSDFAIVKMAFVALRSFGHLVLARRLAARSAADLQLEHIRRSISIVRQS